MTILPKKKQGKEKNESDNPEHSRSTHGHGSSACPPPGNDRGGQKTTPPPSRPGWNSPPRDDQRNSHDSDDFSSHESASVNNKRRHRASPPRNTRKSRHDRRDLEAQPSGHPTSKTSSGQAHGVGYRHERPGACRTSSSLSAPSAANDDLQSGYNSEDEYTLSKYPDNSDELECWFEKTLKEKKGYVIKRMGEDGACLFRSVADQIYGDQEMHSVVRQHCVDYMAKNMDFFKQYITEDFNTYLNRKRMDNCHGNNIEMHALCELYNRPIEIYQYSTEPINTFHNTYKTDNEPIRLSYHKNVHYNSVVDPYKATVGVGLGLPGFQPGLAEKNLMREAVTLSEDSHIEKTMLEDKLRETDWELTQETMEEQVARESYLQWLCDQENRAKIKGLSQSASASSSTASAACLQQSEFSLEPRASRSSPRQGSAQNSPKQLLDEHQPSPNTTSVDILPDAYSLLGEGAVGGVGVNFSETTSLMNSLPTELFGIGLSDWDEEDILAQVIAQSQQEYLDSLRKNVTSSNSSAGASPEYSTGACNDYSVATSKSGGAGALSSDSGKSGLATSRQRKSSAGKSGSSGACHERNATTDKSETGGDSRDNSDTSPSETKNS